MHTRALDICVSSLIRQPCKVVFFFISFRFLSLSVCSHFFVQRWCSNMNEYMLMTSLKSSGVLVVVRRAEIYFLFYEKSKSPHNIFFCVQRFKRSFHARTSSKFWPKAEVRRNVEIHMRELSSSFKKSRNHLARCVLRWKICFYVFSVTSLLYLRTLGLGTVDANMQSRAPTTTAVQSEWGIARGDINFLCGNLVLFFFSSFLICSSLQQFRIQISFHLLFSHVVCRLQRARAAIHNFQSLIHRQLFNLSPHSLWRGEKKSELSSN